MNSNTLRQLVASATLVSLVALLNGCTTVSDTGRKQLNFISASQEMQLGLSAFQETKKSTPVCKDPAINEQVQRVGKRIAAVAPLPNAQWEFVVFESAEANAFCLPGGKVGVYTGILPITKDDAGLAAVIGHEVAHAESHHGAERMSEAMAIQGVGSVGSQLLGYSGISPQWQSLTMSAYGMGAQVGRELPHSRKQESEADFKGLLFMARAGYDPEAAVGFWERFAAYNAQHGGSQGLWFLRTHPLDQDRIQQLKQEMPKAKAEYERAKTAPAK